MSRSIERSVETLVDIESDLQQIAEPGVATIDVADAESGTIVGAERVDRASVPDGYPVPIDGDRALAVEVEIDADTRKVLFLDWPSDGRSFDQIDQLLAETDVSFDSFADVYGADLPVTVWDGFLVAAFDYDVDDESPPESTGGRLTDDESSSASTSDQETETFGSNNSGTITILALGLTYVDYHIVFGAGLTLWNGVLWVGIGVFLLGMAAGDLKWVNHGVDRELQPWWGFGIVLFPPLVALYLFERNSVLQEARLEETTLHSLHRAYGDLGSVVSHFEGEQVRIVVLERGIRIQELDSDPRADRGASYSFDDIESVSAKEGSLPPPSVELNGLPGARQRITVDIPDESSATPAEVEEILRQGMSVSDALQRIDGDPETVATTDSTVVVLTDEAVHIVREDEEDAHVPLERLGDVGLDYEITQYETSETVGEHRTPYVYFEDTAVETVGDPIEQVSCPDEKAEFRAFIERVAERADAEATIHTGDEDGSTGPSTPPENVGRNDRSG